MRRYTTIWLALARASLGAELGFRASFLAKIVRNVFWVGFFLVSILVIFGKAETIAGWTRNETMLLTGTLVVVSSLNHLLFHSLSEIPQHVRQGTLDFFLCKPIDSQFWISTRKFNVGEFGSLLGGIGLIVYGVQGENPGAAQWGAYTVGVLCAASLYYALNFVLMTLGIWLVRVDNLWVLTETISGVSRYPIDIFGSTIRRLLLTWLPLGLLAFAPASQLVRGFDGGSLLISIVWAAVALVGTRFFWQFATRSYTSASS